MRLWPADASWLARYGAAFACTLVILLGAIAWTAQHARQLRSEQKPNIYVNAHIVSQKGRAFHPGTLSIRRGDTVEIVNDDGDLLHHAYVDSRTFGFDSGDQLPGSRTDVVFGVRGTFNVLCGIHPKMKLVVEVK